VYKIIIVYIQMQRLITDIRLIENSRVFINFIGLYGYSLKEVHINFVYTVSDINKIIILLQVKNRFSE